MSNTTQPTETALRFFNIGPKTGVGCWFAINIDLALDCREARYFASDVISLHIGCTGDTRERITGEAFIGSVKGNELSASGNFDYIGNRVR